VRFCFHITTLLLSLLLVTPAFAQTPDDTALKEIATALIQKDARGVAHGTRFYQSLPNAADGRRIMRIYTKPYPRVAQLVNGNLWYQLTETAALSEQMKAWVLEVYSREFPQIVFEITDDPAQATMFMVEAKFAPSANEAKRLAPDAYVETAANSMNASINGKRSAIINFNSLGNPWLRQAINKQQGAVVRAIILNEFFNGFAVSDFQNVTPDTLSEPTRAWLEVNRPRIDQFTITRSGGPREDERLKPLDRQIIRALFAIPVDDPGRAGQ
jgi:hypothetical protein